MSRRRLRAVPAPPELPPGRWRSSRESFPYFASGGAAYFAGVVLVLAGVVGTIASALEIGLLLLGTVLVLAGFLLDRRARPEENGRGPRDRPAPEGRERGQPP